MNSVHSVSRAGGILWVAGYDVDERHWRPALVKADRVGRLVGQWGRRFLKRDDTGPTLGERIVAMRSLSGVLQKVVRKAREEGRARVIDITVDIAVGKFSGFSLSASYDEDSEQTLVEQGLGLDRGVRHHIRGKSLRLGVELSNVLVAMSIPLALEELTDREIAIARHDARNAMKIAYCFYEATAWIYGPGSFGLQLVKSVVRFLPLDLIRAFSIGFARLRRQPSAVLRSDEIAALAAEAERVWLMSMWLRDVYERGGEPAKIINPKRLRSALTDSVSYQNLLKELAGLELAKREFRPWDQWLKSAGKTMSPGLLAMSIGAPETIAFDDVVESMNALANP